MDTCRGVWDGETEPWQRLQLPKPGRWKGQDSTAGLGLKPRRCQGLNASAKRQQLSAKALGSNFRKFLVWPLFS